MTDTKYEHSKLIQFFMGSAFLLSEDNMSWDRIMLIWKEIKQVGADQGVSFEPYWTKFHTGVDTGDISACYEVLITWLQWYSESDTSKAS